MPKAGTEERELTARLLNHEDDVSSDSHDDDEDEAAGGGTHGGQQSYELKSRSRVRNGTSVPFLRPEQRWSADAQPKRKVYTDSSNGPLVQFVEWTVKPGDTLTSLSLKSGCTISHLKRANGLISDQDFYALTVIRIPVKRYGILSQVLVSENTGPQTADLLSLDAQPDLLASGTNGRVSGLSLESGTGEEEERRSPDEVQKFIRHVDREVSSLKEKVSDQTNLLNDTTSDHQLNLVIQQPSSPAHPADGSCVCDGADGGLSLYHVLILVLVVCVLVPVMYVFLAEEHQLQVHSHASQPHDH